jgi:hypothetical protein
VAAAAALWWQSALGMWMAMMVPSTRGSVGSYCRARPGRNSGQPEAVLSMLSARERSPRPCAPRTRRPGRRCGSGARGRAHGRPIGGNLAGQVAARGPLGAARALVETGLVRPWRAEHIPAAGRRGRADPDGPDAGRGGRVERLAKPFVTPGALRAYEELPVAQPPGHEKARRLARREGSGGQEPGAVCQRGRTACAGSCCWL